MSEQEEWPTFQMHGAAPIRWRSGRRHPAPPTPRTGDIWSRPGVPDVRWDGSAWVDLASGFGEAVR